MKIIIPKEIFTNQELEVTYNEMIRQVVIEASLKAKIARIMSWLRA